MELGVLYDFRNPADSGISNTDLYRETLDHIVAMEALGFDVCWITEHHFIDDSYLPSVLTMAAAVAARTTRITIGTAVLLLPLHDPIKVAEEAAVVDLLSGGRLRLGLGLGYKLQEFDVFGVDRRHRPRLMEEGVEVIRAAWADGAFTYHGRHLHYDDLDVTPKPHQRPGPPIWLAGRADRPVQRAARIGDGLIAVGSPSIWGTYLDARRAHGRSGPNNLNTFAFTYPTHTPDADAERLQRYVDYRMSNYVQWYGEAGDLQSDRDLLLLQPDDESPAISFFDTPENLVAQIKAMEAGGVDSLLWFATLPGTRPSATIPFFETLMREVAPHL